MDFATLRSGWHGPERQRVRLVAAVTLSLLIHAFILSLQFGIPGFGLPGLSLPWHQPRGQALELHLLAGKAAETTASAEAVPPMLAPEAAITQPPVPHRRRPRPARPHVAKPDIVSAAVAEAAPLPQVAKAPPASASADADSVAPPISHVETPQPDSLSLPEPAPQPPAQPPIIASTQSHDDGFVVPPAAPAEVESQPPQLTTAVLDTVALPEPAEIKAEQPAPIPVQTDEAESNRRAQELAAAQQAQEATAALALQQQALAEQQREQQERALEAQRQAEEAARQQAAALALQEQMLAAQKREEEEAARREREAMQLEEQQREQQAEAEREALKLQMEAEAEARRQADESARLQEQARRQQEAEQLAARRRAEADAEARANAEALRKKALKRESLVAASPAANAPAGNSESSAPPLVLPGRGVGDLASHALAQARNPDLLREPAPASRSETANAENPRRRSIFGRADTDVGLAMYVEGWRLKIERNGRLNYRQSLVETAYTEPIVTVAVRSDGSVEEIIINRSSGRPELDEAVRRIIRLNARYGAFPPELARRYDVIEIRRVWNFDDQLKLLEEVR